MLKETFVFLICLFLITGQSALAKESDKKIINKKNIQRSVSQTGENLNWATFTGMCLSFGAVTKDKITTLIKEMEQSELPVDEYFYHSVCQPRKYSNVVQSPMIHYVAEDPGNRQDFLQVIWLYYSKKRKEPEIFTKVLNIKNTKGETILDYIETLRERNLYSPEALSGSLNKVISFVCEHGGTYAMYSEKKCL